MSATDGPGIRPVVDPSIPVHHRRLLLNAQDLVPASGEAGTAPRFGGRTRADVFAMAAFAAVWGFLPAVIGPYFGRWKGLAFGTVLQAGLIWLWLAHGFTVFMVVGVIVEVAAWPILLAGRRESGSEVAARHYHGRYLLDDDFSNSARQRLHRVQQAIDIVRNSAAQSAGLLDDVANDVMLPQQEWDIATSLAELSRFEQRIDQATRDSRLTGRIRAALEPQRKAFRVSVRALDKRIAALEQYAERTQAADAALMEWQAARDIADLGDVSRALLARTVQDEQAVAEIGELAQQARLVEKTLQQSVDDALTAGRSLPLLTQENQEKVT
ncbi:hypothetical protein ABZ806_37780 [Spirillospora sp. NPDC047418]|jgi:hypothetical protein